MEALDTSILYRDSPEQPQKPVIDTPEKARHSLNIWLVRGSKVSLGLCFAVAALGFGR